MKKKLFRITTVPMSLKLLLAGQLKYMSEFYDVTAVSSAGADLEEVEKKQGVRTVALEMSRRITPCRDLISILKMVRLFMREKPFIVHSHTPKAGLVAMVAGRITGVPHRLHTVAGMPLMESSGLKKKVLMAVEKLIYRCSTKVYCNSYGLMKYMTDNDLIKPEKVKVIGKGSTNGIDTEFFMRTNEVVTAAKKLRENYNLNENHTVFCFVGRIVKDKGIDELLAAFEEIKEINKNIRLYLVGPFEDELDPVSAASKKTIKDNNEVICTGFQNDIRPYLAISDVFIFPSYREGFPNVVLQAGCLELPCIVTDINGCNEVIENGVNGITVSPKNKDDLKSAMLELMNDKNKRSRFSKISRSKIMRDYNQNYIWSELLKEYQALDNKTKKFKS